ncbi:MAG: hypothetical protein Unbinned96contig1001_16 [Prokaryotic dsDNA virus sp.]|nr:MAG: hypothetical protein Unbinned96contig1001_16 [Prokaryotic dsDNA virus sp.]
MTIPQWFSGYEALTTEELEEQGEYEMSQLELARKQFAKDQSEESYLDLVNAELRVAQLKPYRLMG